MFYKLDENKNVIRCSAKEYAECREDMFKNDTKHVGKDCINGKEISTVWLGIDHGFDELEKPLVFETMIFEDEDYCEIYCKRYSTWQEAEEGHKRAIEWVKEGGDSCLTTDQV